MGSKYVVENDSITLNFERSNEFSNMVISEALDSLSKYFIRIE
jgi:hypothetical protein